jgi:hypothetical protein
MLGMDHAKPRKYLRFSEQGQKWVNKLTELSENGLCKGLEVVGEWQRLDWAVLESSNQVGDRQKRILE